MTSSIGCILLDAPTFASRLPHRLATLERLARHSDLSLDIVVIDDRSPSRIEELAQRYGAQRLGCSGTTQGERLNVAVSRTQGEVLVFPGSNSHLEAWLSSACEAILHQRWDAVVLHAHHLSKWQKLWLRLRRQPPQSTLCVSRVWFERIGGFDPQLNGGAVPELVERLHACQARLWTRSLADPPPTRTPDSSGA